jgi:hypothetical protein
VERSISRIPTAALAAGSLIAGYAVAVGSGSRPVGGVVLAAGGLCCARIWARRDGPRTALTLSTVGLVAFAGSHVLALAIGPWPAVLSVAAATAAIVWVRFDAPSGARAHARA